jgi:hypothetical protein
MDGWSPLSAAVWTAPYPVPGWSSRTTVVSLASGGLLAVNPGASLAARAGEELGAFGTVEYLLAPNHFHHLGIAAWRRAFGSIPVLAAAAAQARLRSRGLESLAEPETIVHLLPPGARLLLPAGTRTGEVWLRLAIDAGVAWIVGDAFFNVSRTPLSAAGIFLRLSGTTGGLRIGGTFKWGHLRDRMAYRRWVLERLDEDPPAMLVPAHGDVLTDPGLARRLRELLSARL